MADKISGTLTEDARIIIIDESDWSIESNTLESAGDFEITGLASGKKSVVGRASNGLVTGYANVQSAEISYPSADRGVVPATGHNSDPASYISIGTLGDALAFGALTASRDLPSAGSNGTNNRGVFAGGDNSSSAQMNNIDYITVSTTGDATDFGDLITARARANAVTNNTNDRMCVGAGEGAVSSPRPIDYFTISSAGNASDFGDLVKGNGDRASFSNGNSNRGMWLCGYDTDPYPNFTDDTIEYITITSLGNATDVANAPTKRRNVDGLSNLVGDRGVWGGGRTTGSSYTTLYYITISTGSVGGTFGNLTIARNDPPGTSNGTSNRGVWMGGSGLTIDYITINSTGDASDFGDLLYNKGGRALSNST
jgi:hypothetical protein